jgi:hypothetical protein
MAESGDYTPAPWAAAHDFASVKRDYADRVVARGAVDPVSIGLSPNDIVPESLISNAEAPLIIGLDTTGSMGTWPATICSKVPYLEHEGKDYLGQDLEVSFFSIGDHTNHEKYPLQVRPFVKGAELKDSIEKIIHERGGGGDSEESYELGGLYYARNCECPNAIRKPLMIFIGDEGIHSVLTESDASTYCKTSIKGRLTPPEIFAELRQKFEVYIIRKPYNCSANSSSPANDKIQQQWESLLGADHVVSLPEPERVVDVIFGILGIYTGRYDDFVKELQERQGKDKDGAHKINVVLNSLKSARDPKAPAASLKKLAGPPSRAKSVTRKTITGKKPPLALGAPPISLGDDDDD